MSTIIYPSPIFGPVNSRRLGVSLGINLMPSDGKVCSFDCVYCECGFNADFRPKKKRPTRKEVREGLEKVLKERHDNNQPLDDITFAGNGFAARNQTAFEYLFAAGKPFRAGKRSGRFFDFRAFARERGLRYGKSARKHDAVRGDSFARFQKQYIADDKFAYGDLFCFSAAADAAGQVFALRHQLFERRFAAVFREGGNERG